MNQPPFRKRKPVGSKELDAKLSDLVQKKQEIERDYRELNQRFWSIVFIDGSESLQAFDPAHSRAAARLVAIYQQIVCSTLDRFNPTCVEPGSGPQIVCCFEHPLDAVRAAGSVLSVLRQWNKNQPASTRIIPSIGIHQGYIHVSNGAIHQSNTSNMAKRIQSQADPGKILTSSDVYHALRSSPQVQFTCLGTFTLKNIPEPQELYAVVLTENSNLELDAQTHNGLAEIHPSKQESLESLGNPVEHLPCETGVFVFIDVCESTKKFWKYGDREAGRLIAEYQKLCHQSFTACGCKLVRACEGDQIIAVFDVERANGAVISSIKIMKDLFRRNIHKGHARQVRAAIGIHLGDLIIDQNEFVQTHDMQTAKTIQSIAHADELLISQSAAQLMDPEIQCYLAEYGGVDAPPLSSSITLFSIQWFHASLRPSLLYSTHPKLNRS